MWSDIWTKSKSDGVHTGTLGAMCEDHVTVLLPVVLIHANYVP